MTGDFNGDGKLDFAVIQDGTVSIWFGAGDGTFQAGQSYPIGSQGFVLAGDFNRDGHLDLAIVNSYDATVSILLGNGDGSFQATQTYGAGGPYPFQAAVGDFNGDSFPDLAIPTGSGVTILLNGADWGGGGAAAPPRISSLHRPADTQTQTESVNAMLAMSKPQAEHPLPLLTELQPSALPQSPLETERGQPDHTRSSTTSRPTLTVRQSLDAAFERWEDEVLDVLAWSV
jgi:hypothetical protein